MTRRTWIDQAIVSGLRAAAFSRNVGGLALQAAVLTAVLLLLSSAATAEEPVWPDPQDEAAARRTAVALNYCRSAFYRIDRNPSAQVLSEERQKILNNLNLTSIHDEEVVSLYSSVLDEIGSIRIAERERQVVDAGFGKSWQSMATFTAFGVLTDVADMNYASLVRRGATSWWDFRGMQVNRDMELWKVEKSRMTAVQTKSNSFLDASWKLARKRNIPDRWLLRNAEFERLEVALAERDPEVRLRRLARMEPFMECYPPYWYYVGRTQQALGEFIDAEKTYVRLTELGDGHFRRDDMLAASMANVAAIRDYLKMAGAQEAAEKALAYTTDSWEVNLTAATVLMRHGEIALAEDAVLRNLDANLETEQSGVVLLAVYARQGDPEKILAKLDDAALVRRTPIPVLLRCAAALEGQTLPYPAAERLRSSLHAYFGRDDFVLVADPAWGFRNALFAVADTSFARPTLHATEQAVTVQFRRTADTTPAGSAVEEFDVSLKYSDDFQVKLTLRRDGTPSVAPMTAVSRLGQFLSFASDREPAPSRDVLRVSAVETAGVLIALDGPVRSLTTASEEPPSEVATTPPVPETTPTVQVAMPGPTPETAATAANEIVLGVPEPVAEVVP